MSGKEINTSLIELHYLPNVAFFTVMANSQKVILEAEENFQRQSLRNRAYIQTTNKVDRLTVPVIGARKPQKIKDIQIDYTEKWQNRHWRAITSAYANAPFFEHYEGAFYKIIYTNHRFLFELNLDLLTLCLKYLKLGTELSQTDSYQTDKPEGIRDFRSVISDKSSGGIIHATPYHQLFTDNFIENLSVIDLLFNEGPNSKAIIKSQKLFV
ncbi:WbqC family protein [Flammeovirgaceae bacterium SG7u.111]|nr:WbqC family protein [Flammeovirgaceae bacterium SG7u.132]WPO36284.1 WbqC family protein [Flammeovirgaceae bacterium SG7u.111]